MNLVLHGLESPKIDPLNSLRFPLREIGDRDRVDIILTNPPFGGEEERGILSNFPEDKQTSETALLFLQLIMRKLKRHRPESRGQSRRRRAQRHALRRRRLRPDQGRTAQRLQPHTIVRLPNGVFAPYTSIPTNLLFFDRSHPTEEVWYYEQPLPEGQKNYTKTQPIQFEEFAGCLAWWNKREENERAWKVPASELLANGCNLDRKNPNAATDFEHLPPEQLADDILKKEQRIAEIMAEIKAQLTIST